MSGKIEKLSKLKVVIWHFSAIKNPKRGATSLTSLIQNLLQLRKFDSDLDERKLVCSYGE